MKAPKKFTINPYCFIEVGDYGRMTLLKYLAQNPACGNPTHVVKIKLEVDIWCPHSHYDGMGQEFTGIITKSEIVGTCQQQR